MKYTIQETTESISTKPKSTTLDPKTTTMVTLSTTTYKETITSNTETTTSRNDGDEDDGIIEIFIFHFSMISLISVSLVHLPSVTLGLYGIFCSVGNSKYYSDYTSQRYGSTFSLLYA